MRRLALGIVIAALLGFLIGRGSAPDSTSSKADPRPGPTRQEFGMGVGFSRSRDGAILAAGAYQQAFADSAILRPGELRRRIAQVATPDFAPAMLAANQPGARRLSEGPFGEGVRADVQSAYFGVPVSYRLLSYTPDRAVVQTWGFTVLGNASSVEPTAYFGLGRTVLVWMQDDWKIAGTRASFGPTPKLATPREGGEGFGLLELTRTQQRYGIAP